MRGRRGGEDTEDPCSDTRRINCTHDTLHDAPVNKDKSCDAEIMWQQRY